MKAFYSQTEVSGMIGVPRSTIQNWDYKGLVKPSHNDSNGKCKLYTFNDILLLKVARELRNSGKDIEYVRSTLESVRDFLEKVRFPLTSLNLVIKDQEILGIEGELFTHGDFDDRVIVRAEDLVRIIEKYDARSLYRNRGQRAAKYHNPFPTQFPDYTPELTSHCYKIERDISDIL